MRFENGKTCSLGAKKEKCVAKVARAIAKDCSFLDAAIADKRYTKIQFSRKEILQLRALYGGWLFRTSRMVKQLIDEAFRLKELPYCVETVTSISGGIKFNCRVARR